MLDNHYNTKQLNKCHIHYLEHYEDNEHIKTLFRNSNELSYLFKDVFESPIKTIEPIGSVKRRDQYLRLELDFLVTIESLHDITVLDEKRLNYHQIYRSYKRQYRKVMFNHFKSMKSLEIDCRYHIVEYQSKEYENHIHIHRLLSDQFSNLCQDFLRLKENARDNNLLPSTYEKQKLDLFRKYSKF